MNLNEQINKFKDTLKDKSLSDRDIVHECISYGTPYVFEGDEIKYFHLKKIIANHFNLHQNEVIMIGSAKLGFSIKPKQKYQPFNDESDIDMVLISEKIFNKFWDELYYFNINLIGRSIRDENNYIKFCEYFFRGWVRPDLLPPSFEGTSNWFNFFKSISHKKFGERKISGAIFRNYEFFDNYHISNINIMRKRS
jgi:hypothetical protein